MSPMSHQPRSPFRSRAQNISAPAPTPANASPLCLAQPHQCNPRPQAYQHSWPTGLSCVSPIEHSGSGE
eukprot:11486075-Alexandrium_andersonii.AAC.1